MACKACYWTPRILAGLLVIVLALLLMGCDRDVDQSPTQLQMTWDVYHDALRRGDTGQLLIACDELYRLTGKEADGCPAHNSLDG